MYGNGIRADRIELFKKDGLLAHTAFRTGDDGADLFRYTCRTCHTLDGYNPVLPAFAGTDEAFVGGTIDALGELKGKMPPFPGSSSERDALAAWIWKQADARPFEEVYPLEGVALGEQVYAVRCGKCHVQGGYKDNQDTFSDGDQELIEEILDDDEFADGMPAFTGSDKEREALIEYLMTWKKGGEE